MRTRADLPRPHEVPAWVDATDLAALKLALERCRATGRDRSDQLDAMLTDRPWHQVAEFASYSCQVAALGLKPWQQAPCHVNDPDHPAPGEETAAALLRRMLKAGISKWHPDPLAALAAAAGRSP